MSVKSAYDSLRTVLTKVFTRNTKTIKLSGRGTCDSPLSADLANPLIMDNGLTGNVSPLVLEDNMTRYGLTSSINNYNGTPPPYRMASVKTNPIDFARTVLLNLEYIYNGPIGATVWGNNIVYPYRQAIGLKNVLQLPTGTYDLRPQGNFGGIMVHQQIGASTNGESVIDFMLPANNGGMYGYNTRFDFWPSNLTGTDNGAPVKYFRGWYNMYTATWSGKGGAGSFIDRINYYSAGDTDLGISGGHIPVTTMVAFYAKTMKVDGRIGTAYGVLQEGANDLNYFAGHTTINGKTKLNLTNYADNAAAIAGGLAVGELYRTGGAVMIVL